MTHRVTPVDGLGINRISSVGSSPPIVGPIPGSRAAYFGQAGNTVAGNTANQAVGIVACPALAAGAAGSVTWTNSMITAQCAIRVWGVRRGTTVPAAGAYCFVVDWRAPGT